MDNYVQIAVNVPAVSGVFDYHLPGELAGRVGTGSLVTVPFGAQTAQGIVLRFVEQPSVKVTKAVIDLLDPIPALTAPQIALAEWMAKHFLAPLAAMVDLMLPPGLSQHVDVSYNLRRSTSNEQQLNKVQQRLIGLLQKRGSLRGRQIDRHFKNVDWRPSAQALVRRGVLESQSILPAPRVRPKYVRMAQLAVPPQVAEAAMPDLGRTESTLKRRTAALRFLMREPDEVQVAWVYAESGCNLSDLQELVERELIILRETEVWRDPLQRVEDSATASNERQPLKLTAAQEAAINAILASFAESSSQPLLLHGVTGSGKTELYIRAAEEAVQRGKQAIVLVPEIALTPQTVRRFLARFPGQVGLIHSRLSDGERYDTWRRARRGALQVVIGPRSALFAPLPNVGLIAVDECHDGSYYQSEPPFYQAVTAAQEYARLCGAVCLLGSATPTIVQRYQAEAEESLRLELPGRIAQAQDGEPALSLELPPVQIVDMRQELKAGNREIFSQALTEALAQTLQAGEQAILFLNRRGTATYVFCRECGFALKCPRCETPLTFHTERLNVKTFERSNIATLVCHRCGYTRQKPKTCPECESRQIREYGLGSERVEVEVGARFPRARTLRWDWETTRRKDAHEIILSHFAAGRADVLVGTQMLAKGLDLPLVTLVGVVLADVGLNLPDPFAAERVFQVLTQVAGRAGRSARGGRVILQTFQPEHYAIQAAAGHDYAGFYQQELEYRRRLGYPPFSRLVRLEYRHRETARAEAEARKLAERLKEQIEKKDRRQTELIGPVPCFFAKLAGVYRWQLVLRGPEPESLVSAKVPEGWRVEVEPVSLL
jgi:primosomal protein N' (replication factor Y)